MEKVTNLDASEKQRWRDIIELEIMSSDDSGDEDTIVSHSLPWLSAHTCCDVQKKAGFGNFKN